MGRSQLQAETQASLCSSPPTPPPLPSQDWTRGKEASSTRTSPFRFDLMGLLPRQQLRMFFLLLSRWGDLVPEKPASQEVSKKQKAGESARGRQRVGAGGLQEEPGAAGPRAEVAKAQEAHRC